MIKTYIVNLPQEQDRKKYIEKQLSIYSCLNVEFIKAVDGRLMSEVERNEKFDSDKAFKRYGRKCKPGEIGCTLSHQQCYKKIASSEDDYALILEDDIVLNVPDDTGWEVVQKIMNRISQPAVLLLSGNYWYTHTICKEDPDAELVNVFDAYGTFAYLINKKAAKLLIESPSTFLADDWRYLKAKGVRLLAVHPHLISPAISTLLPSTITPEGGSNGKIHKCNLSFIVKMKTYVRGGIRHFLKFIKKYESN